MLEKALKLDGRRFKKTKQFKAKRPIEYWLLFFKKHLLPYSKGSFKFKPIYLAYATPAIVFIFFMSFGQDYEFAMGMTVFSIFFLVFFLAIVKIFKKQAFVPVIAFHDLAKFIIAIKGDVHRNLIQIRLDATPIEKEKNLVNPFNIGIQLKHGVKFKPYSLERYHAQFMMKDGSVCTTALTQISVSVKSTKRRSSGKVKTKIKHKHKLFYSLSLKLNTAHYEVITEKAATALSNEDYTVMVGHIDDAHLVKIKYKWKPYDFDEELQERSKHTKSPITEMMDYLNTHKVMRKKLQLNP